MPRNQVTNYEIKDFHKLFETFGYKHEATMVFNDLLEYIVAFFSPDHSIQWENNIYTEEEIATFNQLLQVWIMIMNREVSDDSWYDLFGTYYELYMNSHSKRARAGQFFTPPDVCNLIARLQTPAEKVTGIAQTDPTCGSGRMLLAWHVLNIGNYLFGEDIDRTCCLMTVCNFLVHGCVGEVVWHDTLRPDSWNGGWRVNQFLNTKGHPLHGKPHVFRIEKEQSYTWNFWENRRKEYEQEQAKQKQPETPVNKPEKENYTQLRLFD